ncbi:extracellular catalytic domain type 1 short-chain-length polyhydroxyalkanoate depolymerase [Brumimicrobium mesophilum]|uniref:extracellular catalytic domain type 1 short-chain-length polyhydroxyalkanoate depolymerase n=1 Tax=Brumimicrobium mesophilum TaxID=392717 RepID=UPI000D1434AA|nr:T9SS type A sorting domain-containing protein [Brumimicrobium mesophilum]
MKNLTLFFVFFLGLQSYSQTGTQSTSTLQHDGKTREYILYVPQSYDGQSELPLVINLHGHGSSMLEQLFYGEFRNIADTANFIMVVPNGLFDSGNERHWNFYLPNGEDDIGFLSLLIDEVSSQYSIDQNRIYSTGMSNGGFMSYYLACNLSDKITAIASVTGTIIVTQLGNCNPNKPVPTMLIHGTNDPVVPYNGNIGFASVNQVLDEWVSILNCSNSPTVTQLPDIDPTDGCAAEHYLYEGGTNGATVEHYKIINGGHTWPGAFIDIGVTNHDIDASTEIWRFFSQYNSSDLLSIDEQPQGDSGLIIYPNPSKGTIQIETHQKVDKIDILSAHGKTIATFTNIQKSFEISNLNNGVYFVKIETEGKVVTRKVIVQ